jgi:myo-inositol-1(or 4)-monophosphatase
VKAAEWERLLLHATERVRRRVAPLAGREGRGKTVGVGASGDRTIFADRLAESELFNVIGKVQGVRILSEEAGEVGDPKAETVAIVDPLDGSSNFERGIPFYCTSVAIVKGNRLDDLVVGVVRDLLSGDAYSARKGDGARKNGRPIRTSRITDPSEAVVSVDLSRGSPGLMSGLAPLIGGVKRLVHLGANALDMCYLAEGKTDAFVDLRGRIRITDFAAAYLIGLEAGGRITDLHERKLDPAFDLTERSSFVASANAGLHKEILELCGRQVRTELAGT